jgi:hypothetical protein
MRRASTKPRPSEAAMMAKAARAAANRMSTIENSSILRRLSGTAATEVAGVNLADETAISPAPAWKIRIGSFLSGNVLYLFTTVKHPVVSAERLALLSNSS